MDYICASLRLAPNAFHLDLPFPLEDWACSDDVSRINAGLYFADLRRQFFEALVAQERGLENSDVFLKHAEAEFWNDEFNKVLAKKRMGVIVPESRVLN